MKKAITAFTFFILFSSAGSATPTFHAQGNPKALKAWGQLKIEKGHLVLGAGVVPYSLNMPLFTDYAHKLRTIWMPKGKTATYRRKGVLRFPVGTVITKTFYYPLSSGGKVKKVYPVEEKTDKNFVQEKLDLSKVRLLETRLLIRRKEGWIALPYVWNKEQTQAKLARIGDIIPLTLDADGEEISFPYVVPNVNQCASCHQVNYKARRLEPIGPKARQLNRTFPYATGEKNQLSHLAAVGYLRGLEKNPPRNATWRSASLNHKARAYLDANCAHCHNYLGNGATSGLLLELDRKAGKALGICKLPIAAGSGTGGRLYDIVPGAPDESILLYRMTTNDPAAKMPELGRSTLHKEAIELLSDWISSLQGECK